MSAKRSIHIGTSTVDAIQGSPSGPMTLSTGNSTTDAGSISIVAGSSEVASGGSVAITAGQGRH